MTRQDIALRVARNHGLELVPFTDAPPRLIVLGTGAGITMAFTDNLIANYPTLKIAAADMPGRLGFNARVTIIDYLATTHPTVLLMWLSITTADDYLAALEARAFKATPPTWLYLQGVGSENRDAWKALGVNLIEDPWLIDPLGTEEHLERLGILERQPTGSPRQRTRTSGRHEPHPHRLPQLDQHKMPR